LYGSDGSAKFAGNNISLSASGSATFNGNIRLDGEGNNEYTTINRNSENRLLFKNYATAGTRCGFKWFQRNTANTSFRYDQLLVDPNAGLQYLSKAGSDFDGSEAPVWSVDRSGNSTFSGTVTATVVPPSDARFKENITPAKPQLADVVALGGLLKNYDWNDQAPLNEEIRSQRQLGLIAQEAAEVCPAIVKDIHRTKQGAVITPEEIIPAVYEEKVIPAEYETVVTPAKLGPRGKEIVPASTEEVLVTPERTEQVLVEEEKVIPATYEELDDSYKGISSEALIMKLIGAVTELSAEVTALKAAKLTKK
jgi:hypothetical protein